MSERVSERADERVREGGHLAPASPLVAVVLERVAEHQAHNLAERLGLELIEAATAAAIAAAQTTVEVRVRLSWKRE